MKEKYFVIGLRKIKTAEEYKNKIVGHNHRTRHYIKNPHSNIDWNKTDRNIILQDLKYKNADELIDAGNSNLKGKSRKLKKNSAFAFEMIVDCTPRDDWSEQDYITYLKDAYEYLKERFKGQEIVSAVIHMDETKPHLHITFSYFNKELGKWNQRNLMQQKKTDLNKLLKDFEEKVGKKYGFSRGKGQELDKPLKKALAKALEEKVVVESAIPKKEKVINPSKAVKVIRELDNKVKKLLKESEYYKEIENKYKELERKNLMLNKEKQELENRLKDLEQKAIQLKEQNEKLLKENQRLKQENIILVKNYKQALQIAAQERQLRLSKQVNKKMIDITIKKIKEDYNLQI